MLLIKGLTKTIVKCSILAIIDRYKVAKSSRERILIEEMSAKSFRAQIYKLMHKRSNRRVIVDNGQYKQIIYYITSIRSACSHSIIICIYNNEKIFKRAVILFVRYEIQKKFLVSINFVLRINHKLMQFFMHYH